MKSIDDIMLQNLFDLSHFELKAEEKLFWQDDINHWIAFFSMEAYPNPDTLYSSNHIGDETDLREDKAETSLEVKTLKSFCPRFLDGFVALPPKGSDGDPTN